MRVCPHLGREILWGLAPMRRQPTSSTSENVQRANFRELRLREVQHSPTPIGPESPGEGFGMSESGAPVVEHSEHPRGKGKPRPDG